MRHENGIFVNGRRALAMLAIGSAIFGNAERGAAAPVRVTPSAPSWVSADAPRHLGPGLWEQAFHFVPDLESATAIQVDLSWKGDGAVAARFVTGAAAAQAVKIVEGDRIGEDNYRVVIAGVNRTAIPAGELFRIVFDTQAGKIGTGFQVTEGMAVDSDGGILFEGGSRSVSRVAPRSEGLDPHVNLILNAFNVMPGQFAKETVTIGSVDNANPAAVQLDIAFDPGAMSVKSVDLGSAASISSKLVTWKLVSASIVRIVVQGYNTTPIPDGDLLKISWSASGAVPRGTLSNLDCSGSVVTNGLGVLLPMACYGGYVAYIGNLRCDVTLDGRVDVSDIQAAINKVVKLTGPSVDVNCNGREDVQDIQQITDGALGLTCPNPNASSCP